MLYAFSVKHGKRPTWLMLEHSIKRNFGGFEDENIDIEKIFQTFASHLKEMVGEIKKVFFVNQLSIRKRQKKMQGYLFNKMLHLIKKMLVFHF